MIQAKSIIAICILLSLAVDLTSSQTCSYMWDPVFETNSANPPPMCAVSTVGGSTCDFPFNYGGVTYKTCTIQGPNNANFRPQCATTVNSNNTALTWDFCQVPTDAVVFFSTVRKNGYWTQNSGSTQGGTMIWIYGNRFAQNGFSSVPSVANANTVQFSDGYSVYDCQMHNDKTTNTQLTCYSPALPTSVYQIRVYVNGYLIPLYQYYDPNRALFLPSLSQTPTITGIVPQTGTPQTLITLSGAFQTACYSRDVDGCSDDNNPLISRIYVGGHLCNLINQVTGSVYNNVSSTSLQCDFEGTEVGVFNVSMLVTNQYGRSLTSPNLYRVSGNENLYTFQSYAVISSVTPNSGSTAGGTILNITGNYFDNSATYPLVVNVGGQPCTVLSSTTTNIQCQTPVAPSSTASQYQGSRGLQLYRTTGFTAQATLSSSTPPSPTGTVSWTDDALYVSNTSSAETAWLVGFIRVPKSANFTFSLNTNGAAALFLSTNADPANKQLIADATNNQSATIVLSSNTNYYLFAVGSRSNGYLQLGIQARMHETTLTAGVSSLVTNEIQRIAVTATVTSEQQQFTYTTNGTNGTSEVQSLQVDPSTFLIGFRGAYTAVQTGQPISASIQAALNDLPTIAPLTVTVTATSTLYIITFPPEMGDVPLLTCVSTSPNAPNVTEVVQGVASGLKIAFALDGQLTNYIDFTNNVTQAQLYNTINNIFGIQCPPSINNAKLTPSIVYSQDYENCAYDETPVTTNAFCGQCSYGGNTLIGSNTASGGYLCFAYRVLNNYVNSIGLGVQTNGDTTSTIWPSISFSPQADQRWHYTCINVYATLLAQSSIPSSVSSIVITNAWISNYIQNGLYIDAVTIRTALPVGYEATTMYPVDQSANGLCVFPFTYNGQTYQACTLNSNGIPICADANNGTYQCAQSSIEGVRRLYPKHQLAYNTLAVAYVASSSQITTTFRYSDCNTPTQFVPWPSSSATVTTLATASPAATGTYDLVFNGQTYSSIAVNIPAAGLANRLQSSPDFGFLNVVRSGDCTGYKYSIEFVANGGQKNAISIVNAAVTPAGTTVTASGVQSGGVLFKPLSGDLTRTYNVNPQVEVLVGGYPSQCSSTCDFQWSSAQTPTVSSISQSGMTLTITGTGFSTTPSSNTVIIGTSGTCTVTSASATSLTCTISSAPSGSYSIQVNVAGKGLATGTTGSSVTISLAITAISPIQGGAGGGYTLNVTGTGFSSSSSVTVDGNLCTNPVVIGFSLISCTVPPTASSVNALVDVAVTSGVSTQTLASSFTYNVANTPSITSSNPSYVTMAGGQLTLVGTSFGTSSVVVYVGGTQATIRSLSSTQIIADLPSLGPGLYPIMVSTANGYARPAIQIEYRFYVQSVSPQVGSLYGGNTVYVQGQGFDNTTTVLFTDGTNNASCNVVSVQSDQIQCQTAAAAPIVVISSNGVDPTYGSGFAWTPQYATVQQGAVVQWTWGSSALLSTLTYKVTQVANGYTTTPTSGGFDSGNASASGMFSYQFQTVGTYYFYTPPVDSSGSISMRGVINVVAAQPLTLTAQVLSSGTFTAQSCAFPFTFNSVSYTACTSMNDTQSWCSPSSVYTGQRLYCTPTATVPTSTSCVSSTVLNPSSCSQTVPSNALQFLFTPCTVGSVSSISPAQGPAGTTLTITGTGFSATQCENIILLGSSYQCPITSASATQLVCTIATNSLLDAKSIQSFNVLRDRQGFLSNNGLIQFLFQAKVTSVSPSQGSVAGGTLVTISGDGFTPADTRVIVGSIEYTSTATITYSQIQFITQVPPSAYVNQVIPITILVGTNQAVCSPGPCTYTWAQSATPTLQSVNPTSISGPQTLTLTGQNFAATGSISPSAVTVTVNGQSCNVTAATNSTITCNVGSVQAGNYTVVVSINGIGNALSAPILTSNPAISSISPTSGSTYGGAVLTINGNGFANSASNIQVMVGTSTCTIIQSTPGQIQCKVPAQGSSPSVATVRVVSNGITFPGSNTYTYSSGSTPTISSITPTSGVSGQSLVISGSNFVGGQTTVSVGGTPCTTSSVSSNSITCTVGSSPAGNQPVVVSVSTTGNSNANIQFLYNLQVTSASPSRGSYGGGQSVVVTGDGFNASSISVTVCGQACQSVSVSSNTQLTCVTPSATVSSSDTSCSLTVTVGSTSMSAPYVYGANLTATVTGISPTRGGTGGGTTLTITGTNFPTSIGGVTVSIAGVACSVQTVSPTSITCYTGTYSQTTVQAPVIVSVVNGGNAIGSYLYQYIDLWSSPWTWGGEAPPEEGTIVSIDSGKTVYFDTTTPILKAVVVDNASLIFDDNQDVALNAEYILVVNGGRLQVGTETNPFQHNAVITMYGTLRSIELPIYGAKVLALRDGTVDLHGTSVIRTWTKLSATASAGATQITLLQNVDWPVGSQIIIATTGDYMSQGQSETRIITAVSSNGLTLTLDSPLSNTHLGITQNVGSTSVEMRAEVGLLSRNVVFQGSITPTWNQTINACPTGFNPGEFAVQTCFLGRYGQEIGSDQFGATIMASASSDSSGGIQHAILRISNIEVFNVGQAFRLGRYPVHFHMNGNMSSSYIKSSSIHQSFNRAVNIHASNYVTVSNNVIYNIMGGAMFLEDGVEIGNVFSGNLAVFVRTSSSLLNEDVTPAAFWVTNPNNIVQNNAVAGGTHFGFWYRMLETPDGPSFAMFPNFCPFRQQFGQFTNNSIHSTGRFGVWIFPEYAPTVGGNCWNDAPYQAVFDGLTAWNNAKGFEWVMASTIQLRNAVVYDNNDAGIRCVTAINDQSTGLPNLHSTFYQENNGSSVINSVVIGDTGVSGTPIVPSEGGLIIMWDRGLRVRNVSFFNFQSASTQAINGPFIDGRCVVFCGGWLTKFSQLSFTNVVNRGNFRWSYDGLYQDDDGSLSTVANSVIISPDGLWNTSTQCTPTPHFPNAVTCPVSLGTWIRFAFNQANLGQNGEVLNVYDSFNHHTVVLNLHKRLTHPNGYMMNLLAKNAYLFQFQNANSSVNLSYTGVAYGLAPGDYLIIRHNVAYMPDQVYTTAKTTLVTQSQAALSPTTNNNGDWYYDNSTNEFTYLLKNPSTNTVPVDVSINLNVIKCRYPNCQLPAQPGLELPATARPPNALFWSNDSDWYFAPEGYGGSDGGKPGDGMNIYIPRGIWLVADYPLPTVVSLRIDGVLEFQQGMNNTLYVNSLLINGGQIIVGWPNNPLTSNVDIIITGSATTNVLLPNDGGSLGPRVIGVLGGLDLHGIAHNVTWTRLASSALAGQSSITLSEAVDWIPGYEILLTTTDTRIDHAERCTIANVTSGGTVITLTSPLTYTHRVIHNVFPNGEIYHVAGAVGLLTRNIRVFSQTTPTEKIGFRVLVTDYSTEVWDPIGASYLSTYYKGYARISNVQFIGYGQFIDAPYSDKREAIHLYNLGDWNASRPTYVDSCSFDTGYYSAIGVWDTNGVPVTNNLVYNTYESAIVTNGQNNIIQKNLVATVYWSGQAQPEYAAFDTNWDGAIMSRDATSVIMTDNLVAGVQRIAYRIQGNSCPGTVLPTNIVNNYYNNEAHSVMAGVVMWPTDTGFPSDTSCVLIQGFKTYKTWYYGLYINTPHNIIVDSCSVADSSVGMFLFVKALSPLLHIFGNNSITIRNSLIIGDITQDCTDLPDTTTLSEIYGSKAIPIVSSTSSPGNPGGRSGVSFPYFSGDNMVPHHPWTSIGSYPAIDGVMRITNLTFGFFNNVCSRQDIAIEVSQDNDDGQHPIIISQSTYFNTSVSNLIFNGRPNLDVVDPSDCVDMDCDGLKKDLLTDLDGSLFGVPSSVFSQAEYDWGDQAHGVGDYRIPTVALSDGTGQQININLTYPYRGISRLPTCVYQPSYQMWVCPNSTDYRMLIIESMDSDTETRRLSPVAVMSDNGYIDLINGPQDHGWCNGYTCQKRISTFMALIESGHHYDIYLTSTTPNQMRFRILNANSAIRVSLALYYSSLQQIDVYANGNYISPTNVDTSFTFLMLLDRPNGVSLASAPGTNFFNRTTNLAYFLIDGVTVIDLKISELIVLTFGLPPMTPTTFYSSGSVVANLAALLGVSPNQIRRVDIISASNNTRVRRQTLVNTIQLRVELRNDPPTNVSANNSASNTDISDVNAAIINRFHCQHLQNAFANMTNMTNTSVSATSLTLSVQEPGNDTSVALSVIFRLVLVTPPSSCRLQCPCDVQPVLVAYDASGNVIDKLGANDQPWQVVASVISPVGVNVIGAIANYSQGQTQYTSFGLTSTGSVQVQFQFISPYGVVATFVTAINLVASSPSVPVGNAVLSAQQYINVDVVSVNETFNLTSIIVDKISHKKVGNIQWGTFTWTASASLYTSLQYQSTGLLVASSTSAVIIDTTGGTITVSNLAINGRGMYIIKLQITSSDNAYSITITSNAILVKNQSTVLDTYTGPPPCNFTYDVDYYALQSGGRLEILRCTIYNYLVSVLGMPISTDIVLSPGSTLATYGVCSSTLLCAQSAALATAAALGNPNAISGAPLKSTNINGQSSSVSSGSSGSSGSSDSSSSSYYGQVDKTGLIIGLVVGLVCAAVIAAALVYGGKKYQQRRRGQRLINDEPNLESPRINNAPRNNEVPRNVSRPANNEVNLPRQASTQQPNSSNLNNNNNRLNSPLSSGNGEPRVPSAAMSVTMLDALTTAHQQAALKSVPPPMELIKFD